MVLSDLRDLTTKLLNMCEQVAAGGHDDQLAQTLRSDQLADHLPTGFGPEVARWIDIVRTNAQMFRGGIERSDGPHAYNARLGDLRYSLERLAAALGAARP